MARNPNPDARAAVTPLARSPLRLVAALLCFAGLIAMSDPTHADDARMADFIARQGCVIGPRTVDEAVALGIDRAAASAFVARSLVSPKTARKAGGCSRSLTE
jgi:hypothetical protein